MNKIFYYKGRLNDPITFEFDVSTESVFGAILQVTSALN